MRILFARRPGIASYAIRWLTWSPWSHVAVELNDGTVIDSTFMQGGVKRHASYADWAEHYPTVRAVPVDLPRADEANAWLLEQIGKPYDWRGLIGLGLRQGRWQDDAAWFCSELAAMAIEVGGGRRAPVGASRITPRDLWLMVA